MLILLLQRLNHLVLLSFNLQTFPPLLLQLLLEHLNLIVFPLYLLLVKLENFFNREIKQILELIQKRMVAFENSC